MSVDLGFATICVAGMERSLVWYERLFGRPPDDKQLAEWRFPPGGALRLEFSPARAGGSAATLPTPALDALVEDVTSRGLRLELGAFGQGAARGARIHDLDGNLLTFTEDRPHRTAARSGSSESQAASL